jgi:putative radical SAM enzyme (TIGR03279 family)
MTQRPAEERAKKAPPAGVIGSVEPGSIADRAGVVPGDRVVAVNRKPMQDLLDYRFHASGEPAVVTVERQNGHAVDLFKPEDEDLGVEFENELFDRIRICSNNCPFCFIYQLPKGMRKSLYVKDDDFRLSFTHGNYITLTNLKEADWLRIEEQRLSPLYVSVHATVPEARIRLLENKDGGDIITPLKRLIAARIEVHCQIVFCPGINDGEVLDRTLSDLAALHPGTGSVAIVPVAVGRHMKRKRMLTPTSPELALKTIRQVHRHQNRFLDELGTRFAFLADEFYLQADQPIPGHSHYEGYPQLEDGIGMARLFRHRWRYASRRLPEALPQRKKILILTGALASGVLAPAVRRLNEVGLLKATMRTVENREFGERITVAGLMTGEDVLLTLKEAVAEDRPDEIWIPDVALRNGVFLDDVPVRALTDATGVPTRVLEASGDGLADAVEALAAGIPATDGEPPSLSPDVLPYAVEGSKPAREPVLIGR